MCVKKQILSILMTASIVTTSFAAGPETFDTNEVFQKTSNSILSNLTFIEQQFDQLALGMNERNTYVEDVFDRTGLLPVINGCPDLRDKNPKDLSLKYKFKKEKFLISLKEKFEEFALRKKFKADFLREFGNQKFLMSQKIQAKTIDVDLKENLLSLFQELLKEAEYDTHFQNALRSSVTRKVEMLPIANGRFEKLSQYIDTIRATLSGNHYMDTEALSQMRRDLDPDHTRMGLTETQISARMTSTSAREIKRDFTRSLNEVKRRLDLLLDEATEIQERRNSSWMRPFSTAWTGLKTGTVNAWSGFKTGASQSWVALKSKATGFWASVKSRWSRIGKNQRYSSLSGHGIIEE